MEKVIIHHINVVIKPLKNNLFSFKKDFIRTAKV